MKFGLTIFAAALLMLAAVRSSAMEQYERGDSAVLSSGTVDLNSDADLSAQDNAAELYGFGVLPGLLNDAEDLAQSIFGSASVSGQPLPGVIVTLLIGFAFGGVKAFRRRMKQTAAESAARLSYHSFSHELRGFLYEEPVVRVFSSPGVGLFCLRE